MIITMQSGKNSRRLLQSYLVNSNILKSVGNFYCDCQRSWKEVSSFQNQNLNQVMPRIVPGVDLPESVILNKMVAPPSKSRNEDSEISLGTSNNQVAIAGNNHAETPVLPPFLNRNYELPEYDGRRFPRNPSPMAGPAGDKSNSPDYYYENEGFYRTTGEQGGTLPRLAKNQASNNNAARQPPLDFAGDILGIRDVCGNRKLWKMLIAEFVGTLFLVLVGCGTCIGGWTEGYKPSIVQIALSFGITVATLAQAIGHVSGAHLNPCVTAGLVICGKCSILKGIFYVGAQCLGAICGSAILQVITPVELQGNLGLTTISPKLDPIQGLFVEALVSFVLVLTVCGVCDDLRKDVKGSAPLAIGLSITACHLMAIPYTGSSMNPARSLGPAVITKIWENHWVYWAGPLIGGICGGFLYTVAFQESPVKSHRSC